MGPVTHIFLSRVSLLRVDTTWTLKSSFWTLLSEYRLRSILLLRWSMYQTMFGGGEPEAVHSSVSRSTWDLSDMSTVIEYVGLATRSGSVMLTLLFCAV